ncbi:gonadotropin-releasing hormone II receptor-like [Varroa destructor]|uniref:G-protein coupled receptors family 1 profile domain-containing protein n=1 Tax=Varroa destructor TaxID=109461 RepID=A0A7M7JTM5_VARDE|nr:gonadotropin-releasing hormone II receptor-like [Varroa destructor]XP_022655492.1 gonadotropin-releasing hormone II receptor-like [Varroa destructor]
MYITMFVIGVSGNVPVFLSLIRNRHRKSRIKMMMLHLTIADLIVTFIMLPIEIAWNITVQWLAGNLTCKVLMFFRVFGIYLSSTVLVCFSLDRYFAVLHPLQVNDAHRRGKMMLTLAWMVSFICSVPQTIIFSSLTHPDIEKFTQCVTFAFFSDNNPNEKKAYTIQFLLAIYWIPLMLIVWCYLKILREIFRRSGESSQQETILFRIELRRSDPKMMERHRNKTLRLSVVIVLAFLSCWTPFVIINLWLLFDPKGVDDRIEDHIQTFMLVLAGGNSCVNPLIYGSLGHFNSAGGPLSRCRERQDLASRMNFLSRGNARDTDESSSSCSYVFTTHSHQMQSHHQRYHHRHRHGRSANTALVYTRDANTGGQFRNQHRQMSCIQTTGHNHDAF